MNTNQVASIRRVSNQFYLIFWAGLLVFVLAELIVSFASAQLGLVMHALMIVGLMTYGVVRQLDNERRFALALTLAPLIRLLSLTLPLAKIPPLYWYLITGILWLIGIYVATRTVGLSWADLGLGFPRRAIEIQAAIALGGIALGWFEYQILRPDPLVKDFQFSTIWLPALILFVCTGFVEELFFRGLVQYLAIRVFDSWSGILYVSLLFTTLNIGYRSFPHLLLVFGVGLLFGTIVNRTKNLWGVIIAHGLINISLFLLFPFL